MLQQLCRTKNLVRGFGGAPTRAVSRNISILAFLLLITFVATQAQDRRVLRTIREVNQLSNIEARNAYSVQLEGTVTYSDPEWGLLFVEDASGPIYVNVHGMKTSYPLGSRVKIEAVKGRGM